MGHLGFFFVDGGSHMKQLLALASLMLLLLGVAYGQSTDNQPMSVLVIDHIEQKPTEN
jgi:hypothetical protein